MRVPWFVWKLSVKYCHWSDWHLNCQQFIAKFLDRRLGSVCSFHYQQHRGVGSTAAQKSFVLAIERSNMSDNDENEAAVVDLPGINALLAVAQGRIDKPTLAKEDLMLVSQWAKVDLFEKVKFLYNQEKDLQVNGMLYKLFVNDCKDRLVGLKGTVSDYRRVYVELLWQEANKKKRNLVANGLTTRRSSVYATMQNRFVGT